MQEMNGLDAKWNKWMFDVSECMISIYKSYEKWNDWNENIYNYTFVEKCYKCSFPYKMSLII